MMVYTQFGIPIERVIAVDEMTGDATVEFKDSKGKTVQRETHLSRLRADGGIREIIAAAETVKN